MKRNQTPLRIREYCSHKREGRKTFLEDKLDFSAHTDSQEKIHRISKTSIEDKLASFNDTTSPHSSTIHTCKKDRNSEYVIHRILGYQQTPNEKLYPIRWYIYGADNDTFEQKLNIRYTSAPATGAERWLNLGNDYYRTKTLCRELETVEMLTFPEKTKYSRKEIHQTNDIS